MENIIIKAQHNCVSDRRTYGGRFIPIVHEYVLLLRKETPLVIPFLMTYRVNSDIRDMPGATWRDIIADILEDCNGRAPLEEIYRRGEGHKRAQSQQWWKEKVRQTLHRYSDSFRQDGDGTWMLCKGAA